MIPIKKNIIAAATIGSIIEVYDLFLFGLLSSVIAISFFPGDASNTLLKTLLIFSTGYFARPVGSLLFGMIADHYGRKLSLYISIILMGMSTLMIVLLPGYNILGNISIFVLILLRIMQGISAGGEYANATTFLIEHSQKENRGFFGSMATMGANIGALLAIAATTVFFYLQATYHFNSEYWRILFLISLPGTILGLYFRKNVSESSEFIKSKLESGHTTFTTTTVNCLKNIITNTKRSLALFFFTIQGVSVTFILFAYTPLFLANNLGLPTTEAQLLNLFSMIVLIAIVPLAGKISDKIGRFTVTAVASVGLFIVSLFYFKILMGKNIGSIALLLSGTSVLCAAFAASASILIVEVLPIDIRATSAALIYGTGSALFGSSMPLFSEIIIKMTGNPIAPGYLMSLLSLLGMVGLLLLSNCSATQQLLLKNADKVAFVILRRAMSSYPTKTVGHPNTILPP